ncbi:AAA family ATPase [Legionella geestiana]|uniref:UvrD-helicase domain-containing protein n=1 Tax=Legionella geestiana TaxID=45065 RepID=UPI001091FD7F|nr:UvrD-helicase domain-containing protein [Legionella geestiana]QDQ39789.1 AAA family ATPase [Legionella geestiana]
MLNPQQMAAVRYIDGPLLVLAGAGSGKTRVITQKIAWLLQECGYRANSVFAVTFTNKAANSMRERVAAVLPIPLRRGLKVSTFHTLGLSLLRRDAERCGLSRGFSIFDSEDCLQILRAFLPQGRANDREFLRGLQQQISRWKNALLMPEDVFAQPHPGLEDAAACYVRYNSTLRAYNAVDFDDLIQLPVKMLQECPDVLLTWQERVRHLLIDEYQDSNMSQYAFMKLLVGVRGQFTVVGDDDQSIYAFRGAQPENLLQLSKDFNNLRVIKLEQNYRSTGRILHTANHLIANNPHLYEKKLWSTLGEGELLRVVSCRDEVDEADQVVADLISHKLRHGSQFGDYAILYRGNHQARVFETVLRQQGIPYTLSGGQSFFAKPEIKDVFAYLRLLGNPTDDAAFVRAITAPNRGIGETSLEALGHYARAQGKGLYGSCDHLALESLLQERPRVKLREFRAWLSGFSSDLTSENGPARLQQLVEESGYEAWLYEQSDTPVRAKKRMDNVWELLAMVERVWKRDPSRTLQDVVNALILVDVLDKAEDGARDTVQLMTLHASKGLEFPFVYLVGMEEELLPHRVSMDADLIEEERRLAYVGITRAQKALCMTLAKRRRRAGELQDCIPSRFLEELPQEHLEWFGHTGSERSPEAKMATARSHLDALRTLLG